MPVGRDSLGHMPRRLIQGVGIGAGVAVGACRHVYFHKPCRVLTEEVAQDQLQETMDFNAKSSSLFLPGLPQPYQ